MPSSTTELDIAAGLAHIASVDPDMAAAVAKVGAPEQRRRDPGFPALLNIMVSQQLSLQSAAAIWQRLQDAGPVTPAGIMRLGSDGLRALGLSRPKARYALALAEQLAERRFDLSGIADLDDAAAAAHLTGLLGFGRWSAEIYLMFCLGRADIWPAADIALQEAARTVKGLDTRPDIAAMDRIAAPWRPWRSVAALALWRYYRDVIKRRDGAGIEGFR